MIRKIVIGIGLGALLGMSGIAYAQVANGGVNNLLIKLSGSTIVPANANWTFGATSIGAAGASSTVQYNANGKLSGNTGFTYTGTQVGIGTTSPKEMLNLSKETGYTTVRVDSGIHSGYLSTNDSFPGTYVGSNSNDPVYLVSNNATVSQAYTLNGQSNIFETDAPSGNPLESDMATVLQTSAGNRRFVDWDLENFPTDQFASIVSAKQGTGTIEPFGVRFWNQDAGNVAATGWWTFITDPSGSTAIGAFSSTTYSKLIPLQVGASSTATTEFQVDGSSATNPIFDVLENGHVGVGIQSPSYNLDIGGSGLAANLPTTGWLGIGGQFLVYASSTNFQTCFGINSCGNLATTTATATYGTAVGYQALTSQNSSSANNVAVGYQALTADTSGSQNTGVGVQALPVLLGGNYDTAIGYKAGTKVTTAFGDTAFGALALQGDQTGGHNLGIGYQAGFNATGGNNIFIGYNTGSSTTNGSNNIAIGYDVGFSNITGSNQLNIGNLIFGTGINGEGSVLSTGSIGIGTTTPTANLQVTNSAANATTSVQFGKANQNKGTCLTIAYDTAGSPVYEYFAAGATTPTYQNGGTPPSGCQN